MFEWAFSQIGQGLVLLVHALGFGLVPSLFKHSSLPNFLTALVVFLVGLQGVTSAFIDTQGMTSHVNSLSLWGGCLRWQPLGDFLPDVWVAESQFGKVTSDYCCNSLIWIELSIGMAGFLPLSERSDVEFGMFGTLTCYSDFRLNVGPLGPDGGVGSLDCGHLRWLLCGTLGGGREHLRFSIRG